VVVQPKNQDIDAGVVGNPNKPASAVPDALIVASLVAKEASTMLATDGRCRVGQLLKGNVTQKDYCSSSAARFPREGSPPTKGRGSLRCRRFQAGGAMKP